MMTIASMLLATSLLNGVRAEDHPIEVVASMPGTSALSLSLAAVDPQAAFATSCKTRIDPSNHPEYFVLIPDDVFGSLNDPCGRPINVTNTANEGFEGAYIVGKQSDLPAGAISGVAADWTGLVVDSSTFRGVAGDAKNGEPLINWKWVAKEDVNELFNVVQDPSLSD